MRPATSGGPTASVAELLRGDGGGGGLGGATAAPARLPVGMRPLDEELGGGLRPGRLVTVAGRPGIGKTALTLQWSRHLARQGHTVVHACFEHDADDLLERLWAAEQVEGDEDGTITRDGLAGYGHHLHLLRGATAAPDLAALGAVVSAHPPTATSGTVLVVDYLQRVPVPGDATEAERVGQVVASLKELALTHRVAVVAVVASDRDGLTAPRLRLHHLRGSTAIAYESDVVLVLDHKTRVVSQVHLAFDDVRARTFAHQVVLTVEKNRAGPTPVDLEFDEDLAHYRFDPVGRYVSDRLVDERLGQ